jgi:hypothetical protein
MIGRRESREGRSKMDDKNAVKKSWVPMVRAAAFSLSTLGMLYKNHAEEGPQQPPAAFDVVVTVVAASTASPFPGTPTNLNL